MVTGLGKPKIITLILFFLWSHPSSHFFIHSFSLLDPHPDCCPLLPCSGVHHDIQISPSSDEEAQSDGSHKPPEEPEDPRSWRRG